MGKPLMCLSGVVILCLLSTSLQAANILYYLGMGNYSQRILVTAYLEELAAKGHNVTFFSPFPPKSNTSSSIIEFSPKFLQNYIKSALSDGVDVIELRKQNLHSAMWWSLADFAIDYCELWLKDSGVSKWIDESHFDLVILDSLFCECAIGLAYKFKAPHIIFAPFQNNMWHHDIYGISPETSWIPDMQHGDSYPLDATLLQRTTNTLRVLYWHFYRRFIHYPRMESMLRQFLNIPEMPSLDELTRNPSLVLVNHHYSIDYAKSLPPLCVSIGGIHVVDSAVHPLPQKIEKFINNCGSNGFVYLSFGSLTQVHLMPETQKNAFLQTFEKLSDICFVVKWEGDAPKEFPKNIFTSKWMPQSDIMAHPKIRAFITHAGLLGIQEAVYNSVPLIAFPMYAEQDYNAEKIHRVGYGIKLEISTLTQAQLEYTIGEIIQNPKYKDKMRQVSSLFRDRPDNPLQTAVWWTEFVLRQGSSTSMLIPHAAHQTWYERRLLDVWAFICALILATSLALGSIMVYCLKSIFRPNSLRTNRKKIN